MPLCRAAKERTHGGSTTARQRQEPKGSSAAQQRVERQQSAMAGSRKRNGSGATRPPLRARVGVQVRLPAAIRGIAGRYPYRLTVVKFMSLQNQREVARVVRAARCAARSVRQETGAHARK